MVKLSLNKTLLVALFLLISSCGFFGKKPEPLHVEVFCPEQSLKILIPNTTSDDFWEAVKNFHDAKKARGSSEDYTVLIFRNNHSTQLKGMKSEDVFKCVTQDVTWDHVDRSYRIY